ncbi:MAG: site-2 protease family protein [Phycisphaeraceae bacterium]|nr:site-2 protease family protein [Phycisphaeraceae bacterium]
MGSRFYLFTILGFPVYADASWFIIVLLIVWRLSAGYFPFAAPGYDDSAYLVMGVLGALGLFGSVLLHEVGHMLEARRRHIPTGAITLHLFGGLAEMYAAPRKPSEEATVALAGPLVSLLLGAGFYGLGYGLEGAGVTPGLTSVVFYLGFINLALLVFNMIPAFPLDGGRVLRSILWAVTGKIQWATRVSANLGMGFGVVLIGMGVLSYMGAGIGGGLWWILIGAYLLMTANAVRRGHAG